MSALRTFCLMLAALSTLLASFASAQTTSPTKDTQVAIRQAGHSAPADSFVPGDIKTARMFGRHFAQSLDRVMVPA